MLLLKTVLFCRDKHTIACPWQFRLRCLYLVGWTTVIRCSARHCTAQLAVWAERHCTTDHWHATSWSHHAGTTQTPLTTHPRAYQVQSGMSCSPVAVRAGASLLGRWLLPRVRQYSALSAVSWCSNLRGAANTQQLRSQNICSSWTSLVELSSGPAAQSRHHLRTVQTTAEVTPFSGSMSTALCDFWYARP